LVAHAADIVRWDVEGLRGAFSDYGHVFGIGALVGAVLVVGLVFAWKPLSANEWRLRASVPLSLLVGGLSFLTLAGVTRYGLGVDQAASSRYVYIEMACVLPALGIAVDALIRRWRWMAAPLVVVLLAGIPGNVGAFGDHFPWVAGYFKQSQTLVYAVPRSPAAGLVDGDVQPDPLFAIGLTVGWLREQLDAGRLPDQAEPTGPLLANNVKLRLGVSQSSGDMPGPCEPLAGPVDIAASQGAVIGFQNRPVSIDLISGGEPLPGASQVFGPAGGNVLTVELDGLSLRIAPADPNTTRRFTAVTDEPAELCR
jgi:hypothetical protein